MPWLRFAVTVARRAPQMIRPERFAKYLVGATILWVGCAGDISGSAGTPGGPAPGNGAAQPPGGAPSRAGAGGTQQPAPANVSAGVAPPRRLTAEQYRNTRRDPPGIADGVSVRAPPRGGSINRRL